MSEKSKELKETDAISIKGLSEEQTREISSILSSIQKISYFKMDGKPDCGWKMSSADTWDSAQKTSGSIKRDAIMHSIRASDYYGMLGRVWGVAKDRGDILNSVQDLAGNLAFGMALKAAQAAGIEEEAAIKAANAAGNDASLAVCLIAVKDLLEANTYDCFSKLIAGRMNVWEKGYGLTEGDIDGRLYVYQKGPASRRRE